MKRGIKRAVYLNFIIMGFYIYLILNAVHIGGKLNLVESLFIVIGIMIFAAASEILIAYRFEKEYRKYSDYKLICKLKSRIEILHNFILLIISLLYYEMMYVLGFDNLPTLKSFIIGMSLLFVFFSVFVITYYKFLESKRKE